MYQSVDGAGLMGFQIGDRQIEGLVILFGSYLLKSKLEILHN